MLIISIYLTAIFLFLIPPHLWGIEELDNFRGVQWGSNINQLKGFILIGSPYDSPPENKIVEYSKHGEITKINNIDVDSIIYSFYKDRFFSIKIIYKGHNKFRLLHKTLAEKYGKRFIKEDRPFPSYTLKRENIELLIEYQENNKIGYIIYTYLPIWKEIEEDIHKREKEFASSPEGKIFYETLLYIEKGGKHFRNRQYDDSIKAFTQAIILDPRCKTAYRGRGEAYEKKGEKEKAKADLQMACDMGDAEGCKLLSSFKK